MNTDTEKLVKEFKEELKTITFFDADYESLVILHSVDIEAFENEVTETLSREIKCIECDDITTNNFIGLSGGEIYLTPEDTSEPPFCTDLDSVTNECIISLYDRFFPPIKEVKLGEFNKANPFVFIDNKGVVWSKIMDEPHLVIIERFNKVKLFDTETQDMVGDYLNVDDTLSLLKQQAELYYKVCEL